ncbi:MAG: cation:proton antiporter [Flavobacteriales bacterium]|nr:cation:proton antiporter [Flavobacteriales bacterium]
MLFTAFLVLLLLHALVSKLVDRGILTAPILFTAAGMVTYLFRPDLGELGAHGKDVFLHVAELGLVLLLFSDANRMGLGTLKHVRGLVTRLLSTGMLLTIALGTLLATLILPELSIWEAGILAAILAPTDAGLGQVIVTSPLVPAPVRQALNVEAGLNDGLSVPFLLFFIAMAGAAEASSDARLLGFMWEQLGYGVLLGIAVGGVGGALLGVALKREWMNPSWQPLAVVTLPLLCLLMAEPIGASMFIAAFVAGLAVQVGYQDASKHSVAFSEDWGQLFNLAVFFLFGIITARQWQEITAMHLLYAALSLTVVRMVPVAIALVGAKLQRSTVLFMGWFGPRGLASIVLAMVYLEQKHYLEPNPIVVHTVIATVLLSIFAHGLSAGPGAKRYNAFVASLPVHAPERGS